MPLTKEQRDDLREAANWRRKQGTPVLVDPGQLLTLLESDERLERIIGGTVYQDVVRLPAKEEA